MTADAARPPIATTRLWLAVMDRASQRRPAAQCECTGQCGKHAGARCMRIHGLAVHLVAAPADLTLDGTAAAARLRADELLAWCPACHDGARREVRKRADQGTREALTTTEGLF